MKIPLNSRYRLLIAQFFRTDDPEVGRTLQESLVYLIAKIIPFVFNLAFIKFYTQFFSPEVVGEYESAVALGMVFAGLGTGWLQMSLLRLYPVWSEKEDGLRTLSRAVVLGFFLCLTFGTVFFLSLTPFKNNPTGHRLALHLLGWVFLLYAGNSFFMVTSAFLRAQRRAVWFALVGSLPSLLNFAVCFGLALTVGTTLVVLVTGTTFSLLVPGILGLLFAYTSLPPSQTDGSVKRDGTQTALWAALTFGIPLAINQASSQLLNLSDRYLILILRGPEESGVYSASYRLADYAVRLILVSLMMSAYTAVTETYEKQGKQAAERLVSSVSRFFLLCATPTAAGLVVVREDLVKAFTGPEFYSGAGILGWVAFGNLFLGLSQYQHFGLHLGKRTLRLSLMTLSAAILNIVLNLIFIPRFGFQAAAVTTFVCFLYLSILAPILGRPWLVWKIPFLFVVRLSVATVFMVVVVTELSGLGQSPLGRLSVQIPGGAIAYAVALILLGENLRSGPVGETPPGTTR